MQNDKSKFKNFLSLICIFDFYLIPLKAELQGVPLEAGRPVLYLIFNFSEALMASFLEKLKKGMGVKNLPEKERLTKEEVEKIEEEMKIEDLPQKQPVEKKEKKPSRKKKRKLKKIEEKPKKIEVKEEKEAKKEVTPLKKEKSWLEPEGQLTIDLYQTEKEIVIQSAIAGIKPEDLDISIENDVVTIRGERQKTFEKEGRNYFYQECYWGHFSRKIILPVEVDASRTQATMKEGILTIRIPKIEREKKRKITVK